MPGSLDGGRDLILGAPSPYANSLHPHPFSTLGHQLSLYPNNSQLAWSPLCKCWALTLAHSGPNTYQNKQKPSCISQNCPPQTYTCTTMPETTTIPAATSDGRASHFHSDSIKCITDSLRAARGAGKGMRETEAQRQTSEQLAQGHPDQNIQTPGQGTLRPTSLVSCLPLPALICFSFTQNNSSSNSLLKGFSQESSTQGTHIP